MVCLFTKDLRFKCLEKMSNQPKSEIKAINFKEQATILRVTNLAAQA